MGTKVILQVEDIDTRRSTANLKSRPRVSIYEWSSAWVDDNWDDSSHC